MITKSKEYEFTLCYRGIYGPKLAVAQDYISSSHSLTILSTSRGSLTREADIRVLATVDWNTDVGVTHR